MRPAVWRGCAAVDGVLLDPVHLARALPLWGPSSHLELVEDGRVLLSFGTPTVVRTDRAPGAPVVRAGTGWSARPGESSVPAGTVAELAGGVPVTRRLVGPLDPGELVDLSGWTVSTAHRQLAPGTPPPPAAPATPAVPPEPAALDVRADLAGLPLPDDATQRRWREVVEAAGGTAAAPAQTRNGGMAGAPGAPRPPGRLRAWLEARHAARSRTRRQHERYLAELDDLFQRGDIDEALRRAIPLGGEAGRPAWGMPGRRADLAIDLARAGASETIDVPGELQRHLREAYRAAHEELDRDGRSREAAFVLADLLDDTPGACAYLERKGELRLAASLADARSKDHALVVRLWWKAGDRQRAVTVARRHGCFGGAVTRLERSADREEARALRRIWADHLAAAGDVVGTVDALAGCHDPESGVVRERAIAIGLGGTGPVRARMVVRALRAGHEAAADALDRVLADDDPADRRLVGEGLTSFAGPLPSGTDISPLVRRLLADDGQTRKVRRLAALAGDPVLEADMPTGERVQPEPPPMVDVELVEGDRGLLPVHDARVLADGTVAVVLSEVGVRLLRPDGRVIVDLDVPAHCLVPADNGGRMLAVRRLGPGAVAVWEIDVRARRARSLGELAATRWASSYDGATWFLGHGDTLSMLDVLAGGPSALWATAALGGAIVALARSPRSLAVASVADRADAGQVVADCYVFQLPALVGSAHRRQALLPDQDLMPDGTVVDGALAADDDHVVVVSEAGDGAEVWTRRDRQRRARIAEPPGVQWRAAIDHGLLVLGDSAGRIERIDLATRRRLPSIRTGV